MKKSKHIFKVILGGIAIGALAFFAPGALLLMVVFFGAMKLFSRGRYKKYRAHRLAYVEKVRNMSDEEFAKHKSNLNNQKYC